MPITKDKKKEILAGLAEVVKKNPSLVFINFHKLTVADITNIRRELRSKGVSYTVAKKTLIKKALGEGGIKGEMPELGGEVALAYGEEVTGPARETFAFQKKFDNQFTLLGGVFEGKFMNKEEIMSIAAIPSRETLYAQFLNLINSPRQRLVMVVSEYAKSKEGANQPA